MVLGGDGDWQRIATSARHVSVVPDAGSQAGLDGIGRVEQFGMGQG